MEVSPLRKLLLRLSKDLISEDLKDMIFLLGIPDGKSEGIKTPRDLFGELIKQHNAEEDVIDCLRKLFDGLDRNDLNTKLDKYVEESKVCLSNLHKSTSLPAQEANECSFDTLPKSLSYEGEQGQTRGTFSASSSPEDQSTRLISARNHGGSDELCSQLQPLQTSTPTQSPTANPLENRGPLGSSRSQSESRIVSEDKCISENVFHAKDRSQSESRRQLRSGSVQESGEDTEHGKQGPGLSNGRMAERELTERKERHSSNESGYLKQSGERSPTENSGVPPSLPRNDSETELKKLYVNDAARHSRDSRRNFSANELLSFPVENCNSRENAIRSPDDHMTLKDVEPLHESRDIDLDGPPSERKDVKCKNSSKVLQNFDLSPYLPRSEPSSSHDLGRLLPQLFNSEVSPVYSGHRAGDLGLTHFADLSIYSAENIEAQMLGENHISSSSILQKLLSRNIHKKLTEPIRMRNYQKELAQPGTEGRNCIICAPTGSGKTLTAGYICQHHRMKSVIDRRPFKTLFIVCIRNLIMQQRDALARIIVDEAGADTVAALGETALLSEYIRKYDVVVMTAQILVNCLKNNEVRLSDVDLLVMDECHHTTQNHPYNAIMLEYHCRRRSDPSAKLPQVIGLTASLGVGSAGDSQSGALFHYIRLCANLDCSSVTHVRKKEHLDELLHFNPKPKKDQIIAVEPRSSTGGLYEILGFMISEIEKITVFPLAKTSYPVGSQQYEQWIVMQRIEAESKGLMDTITCTETLHRLNGALMLYDELRACDAKAYLDSYFVENFTSPSKRPTFLFIKQRYVDMRSKMDAVVLSDRVSDNPKLDRLCNLLIDLYTSNNEAKGIILTRTRLSVEVLLTCIKQLPELKGLVSPMKLIGQGGKDGRMTDVEQENTLRLFRQDRENSFSCNLLIATDVAQEGLDMPKCNFVIRYNFVSNEIGSVQSRGRARAPNSECYLIVERNSINEKREIQNLEKEHMMLQALEDIDEIEEEKLLEAIRREQVQILEEYEAKMQEKKAVARLLNAEDVTIHCRNCKLELCQATDMRLRLNNYICISDDSLLQKIFIKKLEKPDEYRFDSKIGLSLCTHCHKVVGSQLQYKQGTRKYGYILSKNNVMWKYGEEKTYRQIKKWSTVPFEIQEEAMFPDLLLK